MHAVCFDISVKIFNESVLETSKKTHGDPAFEGRSQSLRCFHIDAKKIVIPYMAYVKKMVGHGIFRMYILYAYVIYINKYIDKYIKKYIYKYIYIYIYIYIYLCIYLYIYFFIYLLCIYLLIYLLCIYLLYILYIYIYLLYIYIYMYIYICIYMYIYIYM